MSFRAAPVLLPLAAIAAGCAPTYAPPVRPTHGGAPGSVAPSESELRAEVGVPAGGAGNLLLPLGPKVHLELGADGSEEWVMGRSGLRLTGLEESIGSMRLLADISVGAGIGRGGVLCGNLAEGDDNCDGTTEEADGLAWHQRLAGGGWLGGGLALHPAEWIVPYVRASMRLTGATGVPATFWLSGMGGVEFRLGAASLHLGIGWWGYANENDANDGVLLELGLGVRFGDA